MNIKASVSPKRQKVKAAAIVPPKPKARSLLAWYDKHRRILPWRALPHKTPDPYRVWVSEVMLQQTTVATVGPYFQKFMNRWPTVHDLAKASRDDVLRMWAGLGYYRRAHLMHDCAQAIVNEYGGVFPSTVDELLALPGFGPYTAAAVAAIAFDRRANVVDGNVERVMARIFAVKAPMPASKPQLRELAETLLPNQRSGDYAQALMDLGATICTPRSPKCGLCPWVKSCAANAQGIAEQLPARLRKAAKPVRHTTAFILINNKNEILLRRRPAKGLLGGMMEVPSSPWLTHEPGSKDPPQMHAPAKAKWVVVPGQVRHIFSHFELRVAVFVAHTKRKGVGYWVPLKAWEEEALPSVMRKIVRHALTAL